MAKDKEKQAQIVKWAEDKELPDITQLAKSLPVEGLTHKQRKILAMSSLDESLDVSITRKCEIIGVSRKYWYLTVRDPRYIEQANKLIPDTWKQVQREMQQRYIRSGRGGDVRAQERILEHCESLNVPQKSDKGDSNVTVNVAILRQRSDERYRKGLERLGYITADTD